MTKRKIFDEMMEGVAAMKSHREGKITLRTYKVEAAPLPKVDSKLIRDTRKRLHCSRAVFARRLRINERTLEKWEQGRAKPNPQATTLVLLIVDIRIRSSDWNVSRRVSTDHSMGARLVSRSRARGADPPNYMRRRTWGSM